MTPLPFAPGYAFVFWAACYLWIIHESIGAWTQRARGTTRTHDRGSLFVLLTSLWGGVVLAGALAWLLPGATLTWHRSTLFFVGVTLMFAGVTVRRYAMWSLGRSFTRAVAVRPAQAVVQTGLYRYIRHPAYSGTLLTALGVGLALTNGASVGVALLSSVAGHLYRVRVEEQLLSARLGEPYRVYMRRTRRFIPFVF